MHQELDLQGCGGGAGFLCVEACDNNPLCQEILAHGMGDHGPVCVTTAIEGRLSEKSRVLLERIPVVGKPSPSLDAVDLEAHHIQVNDAYEAMLETCKSSQNFLDNTKSLCFKHERRCDVYRQKRKGSVLIEIAGTTCIDFSRRGGKAGIAGPSAKPFAVWLIEIHVRKDIDGFIQECTEDFLEKLIEDVLGKEFHIEYFVWCCGHQGWGGKRPRKYVMGVRMQRWVFVSSLEVFANVFGCNAQLTGEDYYVAPPDMVKADLERRYAAKGLDATQGMDWLEVVSESAKGTILLSKFLFTNQMARKAIPQADWKWPIVDAEAIPNQKVPEDSMLRTVVTHGFHFSLNPAIWRPLLGDELLMTQGVPMSGPQG
jgi:hypothetical protein